MATDFRYLTFGANGLLSEQSQHFRVRWRLGVRGRRLVAVAVVLIAGHSPSHFICGRLVLATAGCSRSLGVHGLRAFAAASFSWPLAVCGCSVPAFATLPLRINRTVAGSRRSLDVRGHTVSAIVLCLRSPGDLSPPCVSSRKMFVAVALGISGCYYLPSRISLFSTFLWSE